MGRILDAINSVFTDNSPEAAWLRNNCREEIWTKRPDTPVKTWVFNGQIDDDPQVYIALQILPGQVRGVVGDGIVEIAEVVVSGGYKRSNAHREIIFWMMGYLEANGIKALR